MSPIHEVLQLVTRDREVPGSTREYTCFFERDTQFYPMAGERSVGRKCVEPQCNLDAVTAVASSLSGVTTNKENPTRREPALKLLRSFCLRLARSESLNQRQVSFNALLHGTFLSV